MACIDDNCDKIPVFIEHLVPIPVCNQNGSLALAGSGTLSGVLDRFAKSGSETAVDVVLGYLGIKVLCVYLNGILFDSKVPFSVNLLW